jgi:single-strand DNA-binding protein
MNIIGRVTANAQVRTLSENKQVVNFSVAINDSYKNKAGERVEQTTFFDCAYWLSPNVAKILTKGAVVELTGRANARAWKDSNGEPRAGLNFNASQIKLHGGAKKAQAAPSETTVENIEVTSYENVSPNDDLPF